MSTAQPIQSVKLDMSTAQPIGEQPEQPGFWGKVNDSLSKPVTIGGEEDRALTHARDLAVGVARNIYDVSTPTLATELYKWYKGQPNQLKEIAGKMVETGVPMMLGDEAPAPAGAQPKPTVEPAPGAVESSGIASRVMDVAKRRLISKIPGVQAAKDISYVLGGDAETSPKPPTPSVPDWYGKGQYGTPVSQWGQRIPQPQTAPAPIPARTASLADLKGVLDQTLGVKQFQNDVPLRQQPDVIGTSPKPNLPEGHIPVESQKISSYKYDPEEQELHVRYTSGGPTYVYRGVEPEEVQYLEGSKSKGRAIQGIEASHPYDKIINGKRIQGRAAAQDNGLNEGDDLTEQVTQTFPRR